MIFGYARVSTNDQDHQLQLDALNKHGVDEVLTDTMTGSKRDRPGLNRLLDKAREGDTIVIWRFDRLARSTIDLLNLVEELTKKGIHLVSLHEGISTTGATGKLMLTMFGALAEFERNLLIERTMAGIESAKAQGRVGGRPKSLTTEQIAMAKDLVAAGYGKAEVASQMGVSRATLYRNLEKA
ncbi:DNA-invertase [Aeromonas phage Asp37]|nr:DNA-invertase [Aeromonas phage Asp37]